jgi:pimeloyl-ACP methyl ester carboxylesterase
MIRGLAVAALVIAFAVALPATPQTRPDMPLVDLTDDVDRVWNETAQLPDATRAAAFKAAFAKILPGFYDEKRFNQPADKYDARLASAGQGPAQSVEPFVIRANGVDVAGEIHSLNSRRCVAAIAIGGSDVRTRTESAIAVSLLLGPETAVVLMDRRGNGLSTGQFEVPDTRNTAWQIPRFGQDVAAVARHLKRRGFRRVAIVGTSMGGWVNDAAAAATPDAIDAVVSINGGASTVGISDEFDRLASSGVPLNQAARRARKYRGPQGYDPRRDLQRMRQPALWVFGAKDASNPTALDLATVKALKRTGKPFRWLVLPNADHEFVDARTHMFDPSWIKPVQDFIRGTDQCPRLN